MKKIACLVACLAAGTANAGFIIDVNEVGSDLVFS